MEIISVLIDSKYLFFVSFTLVFLSSLFFLSLAKLERITSYLVCFYLVFVSQVVIIFEIASLFNSVNNKVFILLGNLAFLIIAFIVWLVSGKPNSKVFYAVRNITSLSFYTIKTIVIKYNSIFIFGFFIFLTYLYAIYTIITYPQNIDDLLTTYLARVGFWLQIGSFNVWDAPSYYLPQVITPPNGQILSLWVVLLYGIDQYTAFSQLFASIISIVAIYGLCRFLDNPRSLSIFIALLYISIPAVTLQLSTAQVDLLIANFFVCCVFLLCLGLKENNNIYLVFSALAFALGLGTKQNILFTLPGLLVLTLVLMRKYKENHVKKGITLAGWGIFFSFIVGSYFYIQNLFVFGKLLGPAEVTQSYTGFEEFSFQNQVVVGLINTINFIINCLFSSIIPEQMTKLFQYLPVNIGSVIFFRTDGVDVAAGTIGPIIIFLFLISITSIINRKSDVDYALFFLGLSYLLLLLSTKKFSYAMFRYSLIAFVLLLPLLASSDIWFKNRMLNEINLSTIRFITFFSILVIIWVNFANGSKSIFQMIDHPIMSRTQKQIGFFAKTQDPSFLDTFLIIDETVPIDSSIGIIGTGKYPISPLFGKYFTRKVYFLFPSSENICGDQDCSNFDYLLVDKINAFDSTLLLKDFSRITRNGVLILYKNKN